MAEETKVEEVSEPKSDKTDKSKKVVKGKPPETAASGTSPEVEAETEEPSEELAKEDTTQAQQETGKTAAVSKRTDEGSDVKHPLAFELRVSKKKR